MMTSLQQSSVLSQAFSVSEVNTLVSDVLSANLPNILSVEGEISNLSVATSGHRYFSLKDNHSTISCALFRGAANRISRDTLNQLNNGDKVVIKASLSVYQPRGSYQLIVSDIEPAGFGALAKAFAELKQKLDQAGYTASERKLPVPEWSQSIAVVTSGTGAAVRDVLTTLERRAPFIPVVVYPTLVQGEGAPENIVQALNDANANLNASVVLLVRGGGSLEDLQAFNDERVAMAVVNSRLPVVSGVGHETDFTIVDFVSDVRAPTPTAAAEWVSPDKAGLQQALQKQSSRLQNALETIWRNKQQHCAALERRLSVQHPQRVLQQQSQHLNALSTRLSRQMVQRKISQTQQLAQFQRQLFAYSPQQRFNRASERLYVAQNRLRQVALVRFENESYSQQHLADSLQRAMEAKFHSKRQQLKGLQARLALLSPLGVLGRGYALAFDESGELLRDVCRVQLGDDIELRLAKGSLKASITSVSKS